jgi:carboxyl-terminal processing protease
MPEFPIYARKSTSILGACFASLGFACALSACKDQEFSGNVVQNGHFDSRLRGTWRVLGEGTLLEISSDSILQFEQAQTMCYPHAQPIAAQDLQGQVFAGTFDRAHGTARVDMFEVANTPSDFTLERISEIPANCRAGVAPTPANTFKAMWEEMNLDYPFFAERRVDWNARYAEFAPQAALADDDQALQAVLIASLQGFNDDHVQLYRQQGDDLASVFNARNTPTVRMLNEAFQKQTDYDDFKAFERDWKAYLREQVQARLIDGGEPVLNGAVTWGKLPGNVGYLGLARMVAYRDGVTSIEDSSAAEDVALIGAEMDRAIAALQDTKALIVDVSLNIGGRDLVSAEIAGRFADQRRLAYTKQLRRPEGREAQSWYVTPKGPVQYLKPVYLLTTDRTVSAGETLTLMMRQLPQVRQVGQATAGAVSDILQKPLPGNYSIYFPNQIYLDPSGALFEAVGIPPVRPIQVFNPADLETLFTGHDAAITTILGIITP